MKIKLKALRLPHTSAILLQPVDREDSSTGYQEIDEGTEISAVYFQDKTGVLAGERLGTEHNVWFAMKGLSIEPKRGDKMIVDDEEYEVMDIKKEIYSNIEDHYEVNLKHPND